MAKQRVQVRQDRSTERLDVAASPVSRFVVPQPPAETDRIIELGKALQLGTAAARELAIPRLQRLIEQDTIQGHQEALKVAEDKNRKELAQAVREGRARPGDNPWIAAARNKHLKQMAVLEADAQLRRDFAQQSFASTEEAASFAASRWAQFIQESGADETDPDYLETIAPFIQRSQANIVQQHSQALIEGDMQATRNTIEQFVSTSLDLDGMPEEDKVLWIQSTLDEYVSNGVNGTEVNQAFLQSLRQAAYTKLQEGRIEDAEADLQVLSQVKAGSGLLVDTARGRDTYNDLQRAILQAQQVQATTSSAALKQSQKAATAAMMGRARDLIHAEDYQGLLQVVQEANVMEANQILEPGTYNDIVKLPDQINTALRNVHSVASQASFDALSVELEMSGYNPDILDRASQVLSADQFQKLWTRANSLRGAEEGDYAKDLYSIEGAIEKLFRDSSGMLTGGQTAVMSNEAVMDAQGLYLQELSQFQEENGKRPSLADRARIQADVIKAAQYRFIPQDDTEGREAAQRFQTFEERKAAEAVEAQQKALQEQSAQAVRSVQEEISIFTQTGQLSPQFIARAQEMGQRPAELLADLAEKHGVTFFGPGEKIETSFNETIARANNAFMAGDRVDQVQVARDLQGQIRELIKTRETTGAPTGALKAPIVDQMLATVATGRISVKDQPDLFKEVKGLPGKQNEFLGFQWGPAKTALFEQGGFGLEVTQDQFGRTTGYRITDPTLYGLILRHLGSRLTSEE